MYWEGKHDGEEQEAVAIWFNFILFYFIFMFFFRMNRNKRVGKKVYNFSFLFFNIFFLFLDEEGYRKRERMICQPLYLFILFYISLFVNFCQTDRRQYDKQSRTINHSTLEMPPNWGGHRIAWRSPHARKLLLVSFSLQI